MLPIFVLAWGHFIVRKRRYIVTPGEMISTIVGVFFLFLVRGFFESINDMVKLSENDEYTMESIAGPSVVYYTPVTGTTRSLMLRVGDKLGLKEIQHVPDDTDFSGIYGVHNISHNLKTFAAKMGDSDAFVTFQNATSFPTGCLNYTIQMRSDVRGPRTDARLDALNEPFLRLQWAIDTSFMERSGGTAITKSVTFHEVNAKFDEILKKKFGTMLLLVLLWVVVRVSIMLPFVFLMSRYIEEKVTGHLEMLKMNGVPMWTIMMGHWLNVLPTGLVYSLVSAMLMKITSTPMVPGTNFVLIALALLLSFYTLMQWALLCSFVANKPNYPTAIAGILFFVLVIPHTFLTGVSMPMYAAVLTGCLIPSAPLDIFFLEVRLADITDINITFSNMFTTYSKMSVGACLLCMVVQILLLSYLVLWLHRVRPGPYGVAEPCTSAIPFYKKKKRPIDDLQLEQSPMPRDPKYFEDPPNKEVGIKIVNVTKVFGKGMKGVQALTNVSFDIYRGEIMVLLGHNGAGKTTLLSIMTGMLEATAGKIYVSGKDIEKSQSKVRKDMGYCTQHNTFMPYLTILEQVRFFSMIKGQSFKEATKASNLLLEELNISDKANQKAHELSGGMKRRLQLACALSGGSSVLVLDEPTSGLDVETRRDLWDLLLAVRGTRTMVLTTHYMEEADALGDRVAALHQGILRCHATPMHLKRNIDSGYRLTIMTRGVPKEAEITAIVTSATSGAALKDKSAIQVVYDLPAGETAKFPELFEKLEGQQKELDIESMGVSMPTLEEVFLRFCSNVEIDIAEDTQLAGTHMAEYKKRTGFALYKNQALVLFKRHIYYMLDSKWSLLLWQIFLPIFLIIGLTYLVYEVAPTLNLTGTGPVTRRSALGNGIVQPIFRRMLESDVLFHAKDKESVAAMADSLADVKFTEVRDEDDAFLRKGKTQLLYRDDNYLAGLLVNSTHAKITFKRGMYDVASIALNLLANILAAGQFGGTRRAIHTSHRPVTTVQSNVTVQVPKPTIIIDQNYVTEVTGYLVLIFLIMLGNTTSISSSEHKSGARNIYIMSGCSIPVFWIVRLLYYIMFYTLVLLLPWMIAVLCFKGSRMMWTFEAIVVMMITFWSGCCAWLSFIFLLGLFISGRALTALCFALAFIFGFLIPYFVTTLIEEASDAGVSLRFFSIVGPIIQVLMYIVTPGIFYMAMQKTSQVALANAYCDVNKHLCPALLPIKAPFDYIKCCINNQPVAQYFGFGKHAPLPYIVALILEFVVMMTLVLLIEKGWFHNKCKRKFKPPRPQFNDPLVNEEKEYVKKTFAKPKKEIRDVMLVKDLHKRFVCKKISVVKGVSFSIKPGECFGVLGVNGAGKTTTFRMIVGEISSSHGSCFANSHFLDSERQAYLRSLSYCPQFLGLDMYMTGYQNLHTLLTIRGLKKEDVEKEISLCFDVVGLQVHKHKKVSRYSGGCMRRLAAGTALSSGAAVTLLDEPSCGVDVTARRRVWANIKRSLQQGRAVIITSHSMDEMETLSDRIAIIARGEVRLLGSPGALRASHAAGHSVVLKLASNVTTDSAVQALKAEMNRLFNCTLKDEHSTMLRYHINENMKNSELFRALESLKEKFGHLIEDYSVSATTLEEVFLAIAQETNARPEPKKQDAKKEVEQPKGRKDKGNKGEKGKQKRRSEWWFEYDCCDHVATLQNHKLFSS